MPLFFALALAASIATAADPWMVVQLSNQPTVNGRSIEPDFVGWSIEHIHGELLLKKRFFQQLMRNLQRINGGRGPTVRLGGNSAEYSAYSANPVLPRGQVRMPGMPRQVKHVITGAQIEAIAAAVPQWNGSLIVGLNFLDGTDASLAIGHLKALQRLVPSALLQAVEVGNEVDMFRRHYRQTTYDYWPYVNEFRHYVSELRAAAGPALAMPRFRGPSLAMSVWYEQMDHYVKAFGPGGDNVLTSLSGHWYGLSACPGHVVTIPYLMSSLVVESTLPKLAYLARVARKAGLPVHLGETNSVACSGKAGVSDTIAAALWSLDWLSSLAALGFSKVNFHVGAHYSYTAFAVNGPAQAAFDAAQRKAEREQRMWLATVEKRQKLRAALLANDSSVSVAEVGKRYPYPPRPSPPPSSDPPLHVRPLYYGLLMFSLAARNGARMLEISQHSNCRQGTGSDDPLWAGIESPYMVAHALRSEGGVFRVIVINKAVLNVTGPVPDTFTRVVLPEEGLRHPADKLRLAVKGDIGFLQELLPPERGQINATVDLSFSGQTFESSPDGQLIGTKRVTTVQLQEGRYFQFKVQPASAVLLTIFTQRTEGPITVPWPPPEGSTATELSMELEQVEEEELLQAAGISVAGVQRRRRQSRSSSQQQRPRMLLQMSEAGETSEQAQLELAADDGDSIR